MVYHHNFPYFQQSVNRNYSVKAEAEALEVKTGNNDSINDEKSEESTITTSKTQEVEKQDVDNDGSVNSIPENTELPGFERVGPGLYIFKNFSSKIPAKTPLYSQPCKQEVQQQAQVPQPQANTGFNRVNGIPGPYQNFPTPVYQFT